MNLPQNWNQITVEQFIELNALNEEDFGSLFLYNIEALAIVTDTDSEEFDDLTPEELTDFTSKLSWIRKEPPKKYAKEIDGLTFKPLVFLTLGEFIDLEHYFSQNYVEHLTTICGILYRRVDVNKWNEIEYEPYKYLPQDRSNSFLDKPITDVYGVIKEYLDFRSEIMSKYSNLFSPEIEETEELTDPEDIREEEKEKKLQKWSWEMSIYELAGNDLTKVDQVTDLPLILALNFMSMKYELKM